MNKETNHSMDSRKLLLLLCLAAAVHGQLSPTVVTVDTGGLTAALDRNVEAIGNLTASNERTVGTLQSTVNSMTASNDRNVAAVVASADRLLPSLDSLGSTTRDAMQTWDRSIKPSVDSMSRVAEDAVLGIADVRKLGQEALWKWDTSVKPTVDDLRPSIDEALGLGRSALARIDDTVGFAKNTLLPVVIVAVTVWVAICSAAGVLCCVIRKKRSKHKIDEEEEALVQPSIKAHALFQGISLRR